MLKQDEVQPQIVIVGPCAAGKTTLVGSLRKRGYDVRACAQEHSVAPWLWHRRYFPEVLVYLDASLDTISRRQARDDWTQLRLDQQHQRLADARQHCDLYVDTNQLGREQVAAVVDGFLRSVGIAPRKQSLDGS